MGEPVQMEMGDSKNRYSGRRNFLKATGISLGSLYTLSGAGLAEGQKSDGPKDEVYERSLELRKRAGWDVNKWRKYLLRNGIEFKYNDVDVPLAPKGPSTQYVDRQFITLEMTYTIGYYFSDNYGRFNLTWTFDTFDFDNEEVYPEDKKDYIEINWEDNDYDRKNTPRCGTYTEIPSDRDSLGINGLVAAYDLQSHAWSEGYGSTSNSKTGEYNVSSWVETAVNDTGDSAENSIFDVDYTHTWNNVDLSWSFTAGYPTVTPKNESKCWYAQWQQAEANLYDGKRKTFPSAD